MKKRSTDVKAVFVADLADKLPAELSPQARFLLASVTFEVKCRSEELKAMSTDELQAKRYLVDEARAIQADAYALVERTRAFYRLAARLDGPVLIESAAQERAREILRTKLDMRPEEIEVAQKGFCEYSLALVLKGLQAHFDAVEFPKRDGRDVNWLADVLVSGALDTFIESGLSTAHTKNENDVARNTLRPLKSLTLTCRALLEAAGVGTSAEAAIVKAKGRAMSRTHFIPKPQHEAWKSEQREKSIRRPRGKVRGT